ncbi:MAG TPA: aminotransferase class V-fold PLP-dependent enzyme [Acidimicrobiales bacterium]|nr:aminotransferase class V-fold PLP-dependent enzyme [Acidimicrobiales bacterium]
MNDTSGMAELSRRAFLGRASAVGGLAALGACSGGGDGSEQRAAPGAAAAFDPEDWASVRDQFALDPDTAHFAAFVLAAHPRRVAEAIERHRTGLDTGTQSYLAETEVDAEIAVQQAAAEYLGAEPDDIALTDSTTQGLGLVYGGLRLSPGDEVLTTEHDFYSTHQALTLRARRDGTVVRRVRLYDDPATTSVDEIVSRLMAGVTPATRVVAVTWVHSGTGVRLPVRQLADALGGRALLCVDCVHGLGVEDVTVGDLGCDVLVAGTHKWLFGPRGTGIVWARRAAWSEIGATIPPFEPSSFGEWLNGLPPEPANGLRFTPGGYHSFEHRWALAEAFGFHRDIGKDRVAERTHTQAAQLKEGLSGVPGVTVVTPPGDDLSAGIVCFDVDGSDPVDVVGRLAEAGIAASVTPYAAQHVRAGPSIVTTPDEVDALVAALGR